MTLYEASKKLGEEYPGRMVVGYWKKSDGYVLNTKTPNEDALTPMPAQFMVTDDGDVYPVNPVSADLTSEGYISVGRGKG